MQRLAENREASHQIQTNQITRAEAMVGKRAPPPVVEAPLLDEDDDATMAPPPVEGNGTEMDVDSPGSTQGGVQGGARG